MNGMASYISDITWDAMNAAGIDTGLVTMQPTPDGGDEYILVSGDTKIAFGPATTEQGSPAIGWDIATYERATGSDGAHWEQTGQNYAGTPAEALRLVAAVPCRTVLVGDTYETPEDAAQYAADEAAALEMLGETTQTTGEPQ